MDARDGMGAPALASARLRGGRHVTIRESAPQDAAAITAFLEELCLQARVFRFFTAGVDVEEMGASLAATGPGRLGLLALDANDAIVGHAVCIELAPGRAEVAVELADDLHGEGLGTILIERLAELAEQRGISTFVAQVLPDNRAMLDVFRDGFDAHVRWSDGVDAVEFPTSAWRLARERYAAMFGGLSLTGTQPGES